MKTFSWIFKINITHKFFEKFTKTSKYPQTLDEKLPRLSKSMLKIRNSEEKSKLLAKRTEVKENSADSS